MSRVMRRSGAEIANEELRHRELLAEIKASKERDAMREAIRDYCRGCLRDLRNEEVVDGVKRKIPIATWCSECSLRPWVPMEFDKAFDPPTRVKP